jgi:Protein of unknown function (DUF445)
MDCQLQRGILFAAAIVALVIFPKAHPFSSITTPSTISPTHGFIQSSCSQGSAPRITYPSLSNAFDVSRSRRLPTEPSLRPRSRAGVPAAAAASLLFVNRAISLSSSASNEDTGLPEANKTLSPFQLARDKFRRRPGTYLMIPVIAAIVGWFTNWLAVQMIFYPIRYWGIPLIRYPEVPLGFLGWQGIVPCKTKTMGLTMIHMVSTQLLSIKEVFARLDPHVVAKLLSPEIPELTQGK